MAYIVTSNFIDESLKQVGATVVRKFFIGGSDYSERVFKWPKFKRKAQEFKISNLKIQLANNDGALNNFYEKTYSMVTSAYFQYGFGNVDIDYSEVFSDYNFTNVSRGVNSEDYVKIIEGASSDFHYVVEPFGSTIKGTDLYFDVKLKQEEKSRVKIGITDGTNYPYMLLYLDNGSFVNQSSSYIFHTEVTSESDDFWRATIGIRNYDVSTVQALVVLVNSNNISPYDGDGVSGIWAGDATLKGAELINVFTGNFSKVSYTGEKTIIHLKDKLFDLTQNVIGDASSPVDIQVVLPSDLAWTLCTCYGGLSDIKSISNPDIDYASFNRFAAVWSDSGILVTAHYEGEKVSEGLSRLSKITDSTIYGEGDGKIYFQRYSNVATETTVITENETINVDLDVLAKSIINRQIIGWDYSQESSYSAKTVEAVNSTSQNSFGIYENFLEDKTVWFVNSTSALEMAHRMLLRYQYPPKLWTIKTPLTTIVRQLGETAKLVNSFHNVTSADGQRITEIIFDTHHSAIELKTDESVSFRGFILDVDSLDSTERFLL